MHTLSVSHCDKFQPQAHDIISVNANMYVFMFIDLLAPELISSAICEIPDLNGRI
jgi:hypothetical protein